MFADLFRRHDISGWVKAAWSVFVIVLPFLGVFIYLIARKATWPSETWAGQGRSRTSSTAT